MKTKPTRRDVLLIGPLAAVAAFFGIRPSLGAPVPQALPQHQMQEKEFYTTLAEIISSFAKMIVFMSHSTAPWDLSHTLRGIRVVLLTSFNWLPGDNCFVIRTTERELREMLMDAFLMPRLDDFYDKHNGTKYEDRRNIWNVAGGINFGCDIDQDQLMFDVAHDVCITEAPF